ncbi:hypothetical protein [Olleya sp. YS]|uniref:hypothetical protein n=1 Tax=Olleya sp. YS TaxID=3028318 RepID=UPI0024341D44|nr:hypothetical protein [Olleya sp. YS]WGD35824.1 hypothetical protein Ollyesu_05270 [Olleya sp. YS]
MINFSIKTERLLLLVILALVISNLFLKQCSSFKTQEQPTVTITKDTIWQTKVDTFKVQTVKYKSVYVNTKDTSQVLDTIPENESASLFEEARAYQDTLSNDDIDIYSYNLLQGNLLDSQLSYKLKVPREITVTKTIEHPKTYRSGLYMFSEVGGNPQTLDNLSLGLQYNRKGKWFASYRVNLSQIQNPTHNVGVGVRVFK